MQQFSNVSSPGLPKQSALCKSEASEPSTVVNGFSAPGATHQANPFQLKNHKDYATRPSDSFVESTAVTQVRDESSVTDQRKTTALPASWTSKERRSGQRDSKG